MDRSMDNSMNGSSAYTIPEHITDTIERCEYLRLQIVNNKEYYDSLEDINDINWSFIREEDHLQSGNWAIFPISDYCGYYVDSNAQDNDKVIYLTFDCGSPVDQTQKILDTLAKHNARANFFVTKEYLDSCPNYVIRMKEDGHVVGNHSATHPKLSGLPVEEICNEIFDCAEYFYKVTGYSIDPFFRTPFGNYSKRVMNIIRDAGYSTIFWSIAYRDFDPENQPGTRLCTGPFFHLPSQWSHSAHSRRIDIKRKRIRHCSYHA